MASWRLAKSLTKLRTQVNKEWPRRSKISDGTIGDTAHQAVASDHNPNSKGVVTALDLTHDPNNGFNAHKLADRLIKNRHPNLEYIISNRRIAGAWTGWKWQVYNGSNPHNRHIHVSVGDGRADGQALGNYDSTQAWNISGTIKKESNKVTNKQKLRSKAIFDARYYLNKYPDVNKHYNLKNADNHWVNHGVKEGRSPNKTFDPKEYRANYSDLRKAYGKNYEKLTLHWFNNGLTEGRRGRSKNPVSKTVNNLKEKIITFVKGA